MSRIARVTDGVPMRRTLLVLAALLFLPAFADAVIMKIVSLREAIDGHPHIFVATVDKLDPERPAVILITKEADALKGKTPFERLPINLTGDADAKKGEQTKVMLDRLTNGRQAIVFAIKLDKRYDAMAFLDGTWFSLQGTVDEDGKTVRWAFLHCEPYLRRTYTGSTAELKKIIEDHLSKKAEPPKPNLQEKPGFGPIKLGMRSSEPEKADAFRLGSLPASPKSALLGVIPSFVMIGPLAVIAAFFPGLFARLAVGMIRWRAFLTIASLNSTLAVIYYFTRSYLPDTKYLSLEAFTAYLLGITAIGLFWAGRRYRRLAGEDESITATPARKELLALLGLSLLTGALAASARFFGPWSTAIELPMREFTFIAIGLSIATIYSLYRLFTRSSDTRADGTETSMKLSLSGETVGLGALFLCGLSAIVLASGGSRTVAIGTTSGEIEDAIGPRLLDVRTFDIPDADQVISGVTLDGPRLFCGVVRQLGFRQIGTVVSLDRETGLPLWRFDADQSLKPPFSGVAVANEKLYLGEGLHTDSDCKLFKLDVATGKAAWERPVPTASHTEGTPRIAKGNVYFTAGDDGLFCVDAESGARKWQFEGKPRKLHIDGSPAVSGNRVFVGSGLYSAALLAIKADAGEEIWRVPAPYRSFGAPLALGDRVVYGLGTGNLTSDTVDYSTDGCPIVEKQPGGAVVCVDAATGKTIWQYDLTRSVHTSLEADAYSIYATSRDGCVHCLDRKSGKLRWKTGLGPALTAGPALATAAGYPVAVYAVSQDGNVACLNPQTGRVVWQERLPGFHWDGEQANGIMSTPAVVTTGNKRTLYVGGLKLSANTGKRSATVFRFDDGIE